MRVSRRHLLDWENRQMHAQRNRRSDLMPVIVSVIVAIVGAAGILSNTAADAATPQHSKLRHPIVRPRQGLTLGHAVSGWAYARPGPLVHYDDTPNYDDPSKFGGQSLGMDP
jgi:hypothetical protein